MWCVCVCEGENKDRAVEEGGEKEVSTELGGLLSASPGGGGGGGGGGGHQVCL